MPGVALIAHFDGDPDDLAPRFHTAARQYADIPNAPQPTAALLLRNKAGITAVFVWPEGGSLTPFRAFLKASIGELGLPHPNIQHLRAEAISWEAITQLQ